MLKIIEFVLLAVSLLTVLVLVVASPRSVEPAATEAERGEIRPKLPPAVNR